MLVSVLLTVFFLQVFDEPYLLTDGGPLGTTDRWPCSPTTSSGSVWSRYNERLSVGIQGMYTGAAVTPDITGELRSVQPGMYHLSAMGGDAAAMPAGAVAWNVGGMGVHWTAATPWPAGDECFDLGDRAQWHADLERARTMLPGSLGPTAPGRVVLGVLDDLFGAVSAPGRGPRAMPMAVKPRASGPLPRTGPGRIFPASRRATIPPSSCGPGRSRWRSAATGRGRPAAGRDRPRVRHHGRHDRRLRRRRPYSAAALRVGNPP